MESSPLSHTARDWQEGRRLRAYELAQQGWKQSQIARALGVTEGAVSQWLKRAREAGSPEALRHRRPPGRTPRLSSEQRQRLPALLEQGAEHFGFIGNLWTSGRVAQVLRKEWGVPFSDRHTRRLLRQAGYSPQKPERTATQRDEAAIATWRKERWPALKRGHSSNAPRSSA